MAKAKPADPNWITYDEAEAEFGYSTATLNRYRKVGRHKKDGGLPMQGWKELRWQKEYREIEGGPWGKMVLRRTVVCRDQLVTERALTKELKQRPAADGLLTHEACTAWSIGTRTLTKWFEQGKIRREEEVFVRASGKGRGKRWRYFPVNGQPRKAAPLKKVPPHKVIADSTGRTKQHHSYAETARILGTTVETVYAAHRAGKWLGTDLPFKAVEEEYGVKDKQFWFPNEQVRGVEAHVKPARALGHTGRGSRPAAARLQYRTIDGVPCESVYHFAVRNGLARPAITGTWSKRCPHVAAGRVTVHYYRGRETYLGVDEVAEIEASLKKEQDAGWKGIGPRPSRRVLYATVEGEWCVLLRHLAHLFAMRSTAIRQWKDRGTAPGLDEPLRIHGRARTWAYVPVAQARLIASAIGKGDIEWPPSGAPDTIAQPADHPTRSTNAVPAIEIPGWASMRPCGKRDAAWLAKTQQLERAGLACGPATIVRWWNGLSRESRETTGIAHGLPQGQGGAQIVRFGLKQARKDREYQGS